MISGLVTVISFVRKSNTGRALARRNRLIGAENGGNTIQVQDGNKDETELRNNANFSSQSSQKKSFHLHHSPNCPLSTAVNYDISSLDSSGSFIASFNSSLASFKGTCQCGALPHADLASDHRLRCANSKTKSTTKQCHNKYSNRPSVTSDMHGGESNENLKSAGKIALGSSWSNEFQPMIWLLMRYLRLTPAYACTIGFAILFPVLGSGPFWNETIVPMSANCRENWWLSLLYINNFIETDKLCLIHSWYLSNDWQFFMLTIILFAAYNKSKKLVLVMLVSLIVSSSAVTFAMTVKNRFPPTIVTTSPAVAERWLFIHSLYYKPWPHLPSYCVGLIIGYMIIMTVDCPSGGENGKRISAAWYTIAWVSFTFVALAVLNSIYPWNMGYSVDPLIAGLHSATFRTVWSICCAWLVYALVIRPNNPLASLLAWHGFQTTSRLTYCTYLVHPLVIYYHFGTLRERIDSSTYGQIHRFMATLLFSYLFALILSIFVESPSIRLQKLITNRLICGKAHRNRCIRSDESDLTDSSANQANSMLEKSNISSNQTEISWATSSSCADQSRSSAVSLLASTESIKLLMAAEQLHQRQPPSTCPTASNDTQLRKCHSSRIDQQIYGDCLAHRHKDPHCSTVSERSGTAVDEDFQRKLAQAIGRGFRIRSRMVASGTVIRDEARVSKEVQGLAGRPCRQPHKNTQLASQELREFAEQYDSKYLNLGQTPTSRLRMSSKNHRSHPVHAKLPMSTFLTSKTESCPVPNAKQQLGDVNNSLFTKIEASEQTKHQS